MRSIFDTETGRKTFSLSNAGWYWISADNGNTWTKQILTTEEASEHLAEGYMLKKTEPLEEQPRIKVIAVYDNDSYDLTVYSTSPNLEIPAARILRTTIMKSTMKRIRRASTS